MQLINPETGRVIHEGTLSAILIYLRHVFPQHANELPKHAPATDRGYNETRRIVEAFAIAKGYDLYI